MPLQTPLTYRMGSKSQLIFFSENNPVAYQINMNEAENTMQANILPFYTSTTPGWGQKVTTFFSEEGHVAYQIKRKKV